MTQKPVEEMSSAELLLVFLSLAVDDRTCLLIGECVKDGKRHELVRRRSVDMLTVYDDIKAVTLDTFKAVSMNDAIDDPAEITIRILRPVKE